MTAICPPRLDDPAATVRAPCLDFETVYREHAAFVWRTVRRMGVREAEVPDVCQEVFVVVHEHLDRYDGSAKVATWLFGICFRVASNHRRRAHVRREAATAEPDPGHDARTPHHALEQGELRRELDRLLDALDDDKRAVFVLYELEQMPMSEVAAMVGCPLQTAYSRLHAARKIMAEGLAQHRGRAS